MRSATWAGLALSMLLAPFPVQAAPRPKLIVAISVDQFSADLFAEYRPHFAAGLKRLATGAVFPSGYQSHAATETCPGHSTILTGDRPARTGIIANNWYDLSVARADKHVYCAEDPSAPGSSSEKYMVSPQYLKVPTLGDRLKAADPKSRVVSLAGKDRAAVMMGGHATDEIWYWGGKAFVTLADRTAAPPPSVSKVNAHVAALIAKPGGTNLPPLCRARAQAVPVGEAKQVGLPLERKPDDYKGFRTSPEFDAATADIAIGLVNALKLGHGPATDLLAIGLSATDYVGHTYGTEGPEMCAQLMALDATIGRILAALEASGASYVVALTADHGGHDLPERNDRRAIPDAQRVDPALAPAIFGKLLADQLELKTEGPLFYGDGPFGDWYLSRVIAAKFRPHVLDVTRQRLLAHPQVAAVFTADELRAMPAPSVPVDEWSLADRARASFDPQRSGDLVVFLKPHVTPIADGAKGNVATHGSPWNYDRRVPILFWWPGMAGFEQPLPVETVDIMPSLAALAGLPVPKGEIDGRCLDLDAGEGTTCPQ
jgi:predicted AlkP superfamily pyrophosphatase or phosphodiesterase